MAALIRKFGLGTDDYHFLFSNLRQANSSFAYFVSEHRTTSGFGWGMQVITTFGATYPGIKEVLKHLAIAADVAETLPQLKKAMCLREGEKRAFVTDKGLISRGILTYHAISLFVKREGNLLKVYDNDSEGIASSEYQGLKSAVASTLKLKIYPSKTVRQKKVATCYAIAISDCVAFHKNPKILDQRDQYLLKPIKEGDKALDFQILLFKQTFKAKTNMRTVLAITLFAVFNIFVISLLHKKWQF